MINQELADKVQEALDWGREVDTDTVAELLTSYTKLIEQNAELHKELHKPKPKPKYGKVWNCKAWWLVELDNPHQLKTQLPDDLADKIVEGLNGQ